MLAEEPTTSAIERRPQNDGLVGERRNAEVVYAYGTDGPYHVRRTHYGSVTYYGSTSLGILYHGTLTSGSTGGTGSTGVARSFWTSFSLLRFSCFCTPFHFKAFGCYELLFYVNYMQLSKDETGLGALRRSVLRDFFNRTFRTVAPLIKPVMWKSCFACP